MMNDVKVAHGSRTCHRNSDSQRTLRNSSELAERTVHQRVQLFVPDKKYYTESIFLRVVLPVRLDGMDERGRGVFRNTILRRRDTFSEIYTSARAGPCLLVRPEHDPG